MQNPSLPLLALFSGLVAAQDPDLRVTPAVRPGGQLDAVLFGAPGDAFVTLLDVRGGPLRFAGQTLFLSGTPALTVLDAGRLGLGGFRAFNLSVPPPTAPQVPLYLQAFTAGSGGGPLRASDGESTVVFTARHALVQDFVDPASEGLTGTYDRSVRGRLQASGPRRRVHDVVPHGGVPFGLPITGPLNPFGVRLQCVYRAADIGATGAPELLTGIRWRPAGSVEFDAIGAFEVRAAHSHVVPDYTIDRFSALPRYPDSGLRLALASNVKPGEQTVVLYAGGYVIDPARRQADGYMPYPDLQRGFEYNGIDSLLLDFVVPPNTGTGRNGQQVWLMVQSSALPNSRVFTAGRNGRLVPNPGQITDAETGDNSIHEVQLEFLRTDSEAQSPWLAAPVPAPDYHDPAVSASLPPGAAVVLWFRGATRPDGSDAGPWSDDIDRSDGRTYLQYRVRFQAAPDPRMPPPSVDQIVIPLD
jgi:hypothetical protein